VELDDEPKRTCNLIERLRKLGESLRPLDQLYAVAVDSALTDRLNELSELQIGHCFSISAGQSVTSTVLT
jgi:hypothetical protein